MVDLEKRPNPEASVFQLFCVNAEIEAGRIEGTADNPQDIAQHLELPLEDAEELIRQGKEYRELYQ